MANEHSHGPCDSSCPSYAHGCLTCSACQYSGDPLNAAATQFDLRHLPTLDEFRQARTALHPSMEGRS